jgi:hypothetical protein
MMSWLKQKFWRPALPVAKPHRWSLSAPLLQWAAGEVWTVGDSLEGLLATGRTGGGKSSGTGELVCRSMIQPGTVRSS